MFPLPKTVVKDWGLDQVWIKGSLLILEGSLHRHLANAGLGAQGP